MDFIEIDNLIHFERVLVGIENCIDILLVYKNQGFGVIGKSFRFQITKKNNFYEFKVGCK